MVTDLSKKYDLMVPRYTSYPTAPHFSESVTGELYGQWLAALDPATPLSLYFHIPFCDEMCSFCGCYTKIVKRYDPVADYVAVLLDEIDLVAKNLPGRFKASNLHWGGGSPTMLKGEDWKRIIDHLRVRFDVTPDAAIAVELDPRTASEDYIRALQDAGVNRASIGVQSFDADIQKAINRIQPYEMTAQVIGWLRQYGIDHVNMDLMYGLPMQTTEMVIREAELTIGLKPARVALFGYAHVPWMKSHQKLINEDDLPDADERWQQFEASSKKFIEAGYVAVGLDHFALPDDEMSVALDDGVLQRNFQGYTADLAPAMIGFGASAIGQLSQGYIQNLSPLKQYRENIAAGILPIARGIALSDDDRLRGHIIERIMCDLTVDLDEVCEKFATSKATFVPEMEKLASLADDAIITINGNTITVTETGRPFVRLVAAVFDAYLDSGKGRHSRAV
ncbi:MAG: oxygen-independent coproporphyrinogen III oxidase [Rhodospirillaceae bacterium]|jgi:oxygen-independent coproporphyrinogen III oxidase|nr:oxygen-independent coproporphyrinogen III oxidase [Rhodospirillaceae bacterium]MBT5244310.1 oxygen-independent coproporphyrinogen III oxidase [Rhodospirillaceae bacterium]MBT5563671.1 oxygen-independent coproporphyrinogen III oxidase [Rhodospirillaceae bacterium]MBT6241501.1 oxygen-independent coproporphyrinogen III oxidase [Rhodospirillaceae bacterium]MBT7137083.1 oxygen-independent coproporphyrinogen III oxidase [Rhodospirillaceae bacterium]